MSENIMVPDSITPVVGWRRWRLTQDGLVSINNPWMWLPRETSSAQCFRVGYTIGFPGALGPENVPHRAPLDGCACGFYAARERWRAAPYGGDVLGRLALWGKVIEYDGGWRGERGYPQAFYVDVGVPAREVLERYGVPILSTADLPPEEPPKCVVCAEPISGQIVSAHAGYPACGTCAEKEREQERITYPNFYGYYTIPSSYAYSLLMGTPVPGPSSPPTAPLRSKREAILQRLKRGGR